MLEQVQQGIEGARRQGDRLAVRAVEPALRGIQPEAGEFKHRLVREGVHTVIAPNPDQNPVSSVGLSSSIESSYAHSGDI